MPKRNDILQIFRLKIELLLNQYSDKIKIMIAENKMIGLDLSSIKEMKEREDSRWNLELKALNRAIKSETGKLVNKIHIDGYLKGLK